MIRVADTSNHADPFRGSVFHLMRLALQEQQVAWTARMATVDAADFTKPQYALLRAIHHRPGIDQSCAGEMTGSDKATTAALVDRLERRGLLTRSIDEQDRRRRLLHLTEKGQQLVQRMIPLTDQVSDELLARITPAERETLREILDKLTSRAKRTRPC